MKVFKYLVALADISVGFLGLFFVIFAVTRPVTPEVMQQNRRLQKQIQEMEKHLHMLQNIDLPGSKSGRALPAENTIELSILHNGAIRVQSKNQTQKFTGPDQFAKFAQKFPWPARITFYIDRAVPFARVTKTIDLVQQKKQEIQIQIATLRKN